MYQFTQKHKKIILVVVVVFLLPFIGFSFYPLLSRMGGGPGGLAGKLEIAGKTESVSVDELRKQQKRLKAAAGLGLSGAPRGDIAADDVWLHLAQVKEAEAMGVRVSDDQIREQLQGIWAQIQQQRRQPFGPAEWKAFLKRARIRPVVAEAAMREILKSRELMAARMTDTGVSMDNVLENFQNSNRKVTLRAVRFGVDEIQASLDPVDFPLEPKLKEFYNDPANKPLLESEEDLMNPRLFESVEVLYAKLDAFDPSKHTDFLKDEQPTDEELTQAYEGLKYQLYKVEPKKDDATPDPKKDPPEDKVNQDNPAPGTTDFKTFDEVKDDVTKRVLFRKFMQKVHREVKVAYDEAVEAAKKAKAAKTDGEKDKKAEGEPAKEDDTKDDEDDTIPPVVLDLQAVANKYQGLVTLMKLGPLDREALDDVEPFKEEAPYALAGHLSPLTEGMLADAAYTNAASDFAFFARLLKQRPRQLKTLESAEKEVREVVMRKAAREAAQEKASEFNDALEAKVKALIKPELDKEVNAPLAAEKKQAIADANAARAKDKKPALTAEDPEMKEIEDRFAKLKELRETPFVEKAMREKAGEVFEQVAADLKLETTEYSFYEPPLPSRGDRSFDWGRSMRDQKRFPIVGFLKHNGVLRSLKNVGDVSNVVTDNDEATYVLKLTAVDKPSWDRIDPKSLQRAIEQEQQAMDFLKQTEGFGAGALTKRYKLESNIRTTERGPAPTSAP